MIVDAIEQTIGCCEEQVKHELRNLINPLYWLRELLFFILRIPFILIQATGFDTDKVEEHLVGHLFKTLELALIFYLLLRLGFKRTDILDIVRSFLGLPSG